MADGKRSSKQGKTCHLLNVKNPTRVAERLKLTFHRVEAKLLFAKGDKKADVGLTLLDVSPHGAGLYCGQMFAKGAGIELSLSEPHNLKIRGLVAWCVPAASRMSSLVVKYPYRCGIQFIFDSDAQKNALLEFIQKIGEKLVPGVTATPTAAPPADVATPPSAEAPALTEVPAAPPATEEKKAA